MVFCPRFNNMFGIKKILRIDMDGARGIRSENKDRVIVVSGYEGLGKSNLILNFFDFWYEEVLQVKDYGEHYIKYFGANKKEFIGALSTAPKYHMIVHDEALKDLYARDAISTFNKDLNRAYFVIRGKNLFTVLACPSILDLDPNFRRRRVTGMLHVYSKGKFSYYGKEKLNKLIPALMKQQIYSARPDPRYAKDEKWKKIVPDFTDTFPMYKGPLLDKYLQRKDKNMEATVQELANKYMGEDEDGATGNPSSSSKRMAAYKARVAELIKLGESKRNIQKKLQLGFPVLNKMYDELYDEGKITI